MNTIRPLSLLAVIIISLSMFSCKPAEEPAVVPGKPSLTDLSGELSEEERCGAIRFKVSVPEADAAWIKVSRPVRGNPVQSFSAGGGCRMDKGIPS